MVNVSLYFSDDFHIINDNNSKNNDNNDIVRNIISYYYMHFLQLKMPVPSQEYDSCCPFV